MHTEIKKLQFGSLVSLLLLVNLQVSGISAQLTQKQGRMEAMEPINTQDSISLTFHKVENGAVSNALDLTEGKVEFFTGDTVRIVYKAPFKSYIYMVNYSTSGGAALVYPRSEAQNIELPENKEKDFSFRLTNNENVFGPVREELIVIVAKSKINNPSLHDVLNNSAQLDSLKLKTKDTMATSQQKVDLKKLESKAKLPDPPADALKAPEQKTVVTKASKATKVVKVIGGIACSVMTAWLGNVLGKFCSAVGGFGAMEFEQDEQSNTLSGSPAGPAEKVYVRLSFEHRARS